MNRKSSLNRSLFIGFLFIVGLILFRLLDVVVKRSRPESVDTVAFHRSGFRAHLKWEEQIWRRTKPSSARNPLHPPPGSTSRTLSADKGEGRAILLVGAAGYIGSHVAKYLRENGWLPIVLDNMVRGHAPFARYGPLYDASISDVNVLDTIFTDHDVFAVMHFAAFAYVGESVVNPSIYYHNNIEETLYLLDRMVAHGVERFIFSSTCATFGIPDTLPITEDAPQHPVNPYGRSKLFLEMIVKDFATAYPQLRYGILRYFNAAGADPGGEIGELHDPETHLIPLVLAAAAGDKPAVEIYGTDFQTKDGTCVRDYIHVYDLAQAHALGMMALRDASSSFAFNLGNGLGYSVREVIHTVERVTGRKVPYTERGRRAGDPPALVGSSEAAKLNLGWRPLYAELEAIVNHSWRWYQFVHSDRFRDVYPTIALPGSRFLAPEDRIM